MQWIIYTVQIMTAHGPDYFTIDAPSNIYADVYHETLSTYGKGYIDGATALHYRQPMHASIKLMPGDSETRRAYVIGYKEGYSRRNTAQGF